MKTNIPEEIKQTVQQLYTSCREKLSGITPVTILNINSDYTIVAYGKTASPENIWLLEIGSEITANKYFRYYPPTAGEVEEAIQIIEDEVMTLSKRLPADSSLYSFDSGIREITLLTGSSSANTDSTIFTRTDIELVFGRLASIITGRPLSSDNLPATKSFAATLLILREVMFHLKFMGIKIL